MKTSSSKGNVRKVFITFLLLIAAIAAIGLVARILIEKKLTSLLSVIQKNSPSSDKANSVLLLLYQSENDFQSSVFANDANGRQLYKEKLQLAFKEIDSICKQKNENEYLKSEEQDSKIQALYQKKIALANQVFLIKENFDSLLNALDKDSYIKVPGLKIDSFKNSRNYSIHNADTSSTAANVKVKKRSFFSRVKDVFNRKADTINGKSAMLINKEGKYYSDSISLSVAHSADIYYQHSLGRLRKRQQDLSVYYTNLLQANKNLIGQVAEIINQLKDVESQLAQNLAVLAEREYSEAFVILRLTSIISLVLVTLFSLALVYYIYRIDRTEKQLTKEHDLATRLAQQKTDLLAVMSHEIRTPLSTIIGFLKELRGSGISGHQNEMMDAIQLSSDMLLASVNDVLDMTKLDSGQFQLNMQQFNPGSVMQSVVDNMKFTASDKNILLNFSYTGDKQVNLVGDVLRLKQVLLNLLSNAIKFTDRGSVTVECRLEHKEKETILHFSVADTGKGIPKSQQARLFTKYFQAIFSKESAGTGLGLYICSRLIQLQNGTISVDSEVGKGTTFKVAIPYTQGNGNIELKPDATKPAVNVSVFAGKTILIVDDNDLNLRLFSIVMQGWDVKLLLIKSGSKALELLSKEKIDLVITDLNMSEMSGRELVLKIRKLSKTVPVMLVTGYKFKLEEIKQLKQDGFTDIMFKPFNEAQLAHKLYAVL
ncbi:hybrid sensor histidine kinase/response regulator [Chitinophagaceae bacterium LWZ2-11]